MPDRRAADPAVRGAAPVEPSRGQMSGHLRIELSALTSARVGDGQWGLGLGALSLLDFSGWLVGFQGRGDHYQMLTGARSGAALELGPLAGRRLRFAELAVDFLAGLAATFQGTATYEMRSSDGTKVSASNTSTVLRLLLGARVNFHPVSTVCPFVGVEGELGPARDGDGDVPNAPRLPIWTFGLALGATVGTP
jgi:hypothetical protein